MAGNKYLLDTHALVWFQKNNPRLSRRAIVIIENPSNIILFSQVSLLELVIKQRLGKMPEFLVSTDDVNYQAEEDGFTLVSIQNIHFSRYSQIELFESHKDPFDRLLIATAIEENATILSGDEKFKLYQGSVKVIW